jgi:demethylmenaquinone methyltransferase/2-methoxy-6-polyprenyl-1,4-benzoquinol methylase
MKQYLQNKKGLVQNVFNNVYDKYDLMNDFMSFGVHRFWKKDLIMMMSPNINKKLIDVACGTGDIGKLFLEVVKNKGQVFNVDPNKKMIEQGKKRIGSLKNMSWKLGKAEKLRFEKNFFDYYTISFGLRNTKDINKSIKEAYRVLKPGGRFLCLEFSKIENSNINFLYKNYSRLIPEIGKLIVGKKDPYRYLLESIDKFINQNELIEFMKKNGFKKCTYRNLSGGLVAIHSGWKV